MSNIPGCYTEKNKPKDFSIKFQSAGCILKLPDGRILLLLRCKDGTWGLPAGGVEMGETPSVAAARETKEETGITLQPYKMRIIGKFYVRYEEYDFVFHLYAYEFNEEPEVHLNPKEHEDLRWIDHREAIADPLLIGGLKECLIFCLGL